MTSGSFLHPDHPHSPLRRAGQGGRGLPALEAAMASRDARMVTVDRQGRHSVGSREGDFDPSIHVYLGWSDPADASTDDPGEHHWFARRGKTDGPALREARLSPLMRDVVTTATAILAWHDLEPACEVCGAPTTPQRGGFVRQCTRCTALLFPRHDPAVIVAVLDPEDRLLLAHQASWPAGRVSVLAGFVEAGESLEQTCGREILEEVGLAITSARYVASQSWPFPRSLMLGFVARAEGQPAPDGVEIEWARWFTREELLAGQEGGGLTIPGPASLGRRLIDDWLAGHLHA